MQFFRYFLCVCLVASSSAQSAQRSLCPVVLSSPNVTNDFGGQLRDIVQASNNSDLVNELIKIQVIHSKYFRKIVISELNASSTEEAVTALQSLPPESIGGLALKVLETFVERREANRDLYYPFDNRQVAQFLRSTDQTRLLDKISEALIVTRLKGHFLNEDQFVTEREWRAFRSQSGILRSLLSFGPSDPEEYILSTGTAAIAAMLTFIVDMMLMTSFFGTYERPWITIALGAVWGIWTLNGMFSVPHRSFNATMNRAQQAVTSAVQELASRNENSGLFDIAMLTLHTRYSLGLREEIATEGAASNSQLTRGQDLLNIFISDIGFWWSQMQSKADEQITKGPIQNIDIVNMRLAAEQLTQAMGEANTLVIALVDDPSVQDQDELRAVLGNIQQFLQGHLQRVRSIETQINALSGGAEANRFNEILRSIDIQALPAPPGPNQ